MKVHVISNTYERCCIKLNIMYILSFFYSLKQAYEIRNLDFFLFPCTMVFEIDAKDDVSRLVSEAKAQNIHHCRSKIGMYVSSNTVRYMLSCRRSNEKVKTKNTATSKILSAGLRVKMSKYV